MSHEIGDVIVWGGWPGHVGMIYSPEVGRESAKIIHAQNKPGFHIEPSVTEVNGTIHYMLHKDYAVYRPHWGTRTDKAAKQRLLQQVAEEIRDHAKYGLYRAFRLFAGSSTYGSGARARLKKYRERRAGGFLEKGKQKFVTTITCAEAVILCYQLSFAESDNPFFILLDAAHTMPATLGEWLKSNWGPAT